MVEPLGCTGHGALHRGMPIDEAEARLMPSALVIRPFAPLTMKPNLFPEAPGRFWETEMRRIDEIMVQKMNSFMAIGDGIDAAITPIL
jgi:hypothetical protein